jgi:hypothetical protein
MCVEMPCEELDSLYMAPAPEIGYLVNQLG